MSPQTALALVDEVLAVKGATLHIDARMREALQVLRNATAKALEG